MDEQNRTSVIHTADDGQLVNACVVVPVIELTKVNYA